MLRDSRAGRGQPQPPRLLSGNTHVALGPRDYPAGDGSPYGRRTPRSNRRLAQPGPVGVSSRLDSRRAARGAPEHRRRGGPAGARAAVARADGRDVRRRRRGGDRFRLLSGRLSQPGRDHGALHGRHGAVALHRFAHRAFDRRGDRGRGGSRVHRWSGGRSRSRCRIRGASVGDRGAGRGGVPCRSGRECLARAAGLGRRLVSDGARRRSVAAETVSHGTAVDRGRV